eukprot:CAMPEP_0198129658 /NCGR_PEP_ID=MMETSP1442-20131203/52244_1 /TAXON_ID= /ORGANISM="Craspedostauros australis, Strain CCMP3328" /LENGTH=358 /DNA_ID=CAMNT_0043790099 /DNA_START=103 /DNA_END=1179 /DNA_ORIENTATION=-
MADESPPPASTVASRSTNTKGGDADAAAVHLVIQRFRGCSLLVEESRVVTVGEHPPSPKSVEEVLLGASSASASKDADANAQQQQHQEETLRPTGILAYVSFSKTANRETVQQAARTLLNLPVVTIGSWGDGSTTQSLLQMAKKLETTANPTRVHPLLFLIIVPQANLISKVKSQGRSIQYHHQIQKDLGKELYEHFNDCLRSMLLEQQCQCRGIAMTASSLSSQNKTKSSIPDPSIPPSRLFEDAAQYQGLYTAERDENGLPVTNRTTNEALTKSAKKKLRKVLEAHNKRHDKYLAQKPDASKAPTVAESSVSSKMEDKESMQLDPKFVTLVCGTFGKRQGLTFHSDMGPFCHVVQI